MLLPRLGSGRLTLARRRRRLGCQYASFLVFQRDDPITEEKRRVTQQKKPKPLSRKTTTKATKPFSACLSIFPQVGGAGE